MLGLNAKRYAKAYVYLLVSLSLSFGLEAHSIAIGSQQNPQSGTMGLQATIPSPPPSQSATITVPSSGQSFTSLPITVSGLCPSNLLIKVLDNNIFVGSALCSGGSYSLKIFLFNGLNDLIAQDYDNLGQSGPISNKVSVTFNGGQNFLTGSRVTLTSQYAELGANPGQTINWPIVISGGVPPYALSVDWGDGQPAKLQAVANSGTATISHVYNTSGVYTVTVTATDSKGATAFLQLVGVGNGQINKTNNTKKVQTTTSSASTSLPWWVLALFSAFMVVAFWLGNRHGKVVLLKKYNR